MDLNMSPIPTGLSVQTAAVDEGGEIQAVLMLITTPPGIHGYFLSPDQAVQIGNQMINLGQQILKDVNHRLTVVRKPGIVVPGSHQGHPSSGGD